MQLEQIISLANQSSRLSFLAMERSLRSTGCTLPMRVIPYDSELFELPANALWWKEPTLWDWLRQEHAHPMMAKYQCLTLEKYQYVDSDVCFVRDPANALLNFNGWVVACTEWNKPKWTFTSESARFMSRHTSTWLKTVFNAVQFACERKLYDDYESLAEDLLRPEFVETCLRCEIHDQPGLNFLVFKSRISVTNLTLPPHGMESTWAGDYPAEYQHLWSDEKTTPYLIHWAGSLLDHHLPINELFYSFLTRAERAEWDERQRARCTQHAKAYRQSLSLAGRVKHDGKRFVKATLKTFGIASTFHRTPDRIEST